MKRNIFRVLLLIGLFFYLPFQSKAWGVLGHRIVGEIADKYVNATARAKIRTILGTESIAMASNWADFIKSDSSFRYLNSWHYINLDSGLSYNNVKDYLKNDTATDVYTKINFLVKELKNKKLPKDKKLFYLRLLIHFVGDVHQPMHVSRKSDLGGNTIKVLWFSEPSNMHRVWDENLIESQQLSYTEYATAINHPGISLRKKWQTQPMVDWFYESYEISEQLHTEIKQPNQRLGYEYNFDHIETLNRRLLQGGVRLAALLNKIFDK
jgi:hypothetical protein